MDRGLVAAPGNFDVAVNSTDSTVVVAPRGEIDLATVGLVRDAVDAHWHPGDALVLDLRGVEFIDTSGLRYTLELTDRATRERWDLRFVRGPRPVQRVFEVAGVESRLPFVDDPAASPPAE